MDAVIQDQDADQAQMSNTDNEELDDDFEFDEIERKEVRILSEKVERGKVLEALHFWVGKDSIAHQHQKNARAWV